MKIGEPRSVKKSVDISAPAEKVFEICSDPKAFALYVPGVENVSGVREGNGHIGDTFKANYAFLGSSFEEVLTFAEYERPKKISTRFEGPLKANIKIDLEQRDGLTKATLEYKYEKINGNVVLAAGNQRLVEGRVEKDAQYLLENLKMVCELPLEGKTTTTTSPTNS